jgi:hypothetical protein
MADLDSAAGKPLVILSKIGLSRMALDKGVQIINISTLDSPFIEGAYQTTGEAGGVYVKNNYA